MNYIFGQNEFLKKYRSLHDDDRKRVWIILEMSNGDEIFLEEYDQWLTMEEYCRANNVKIDKVKLRYRSHTVEYPTKDCDGVYIVKTAKGMMGGQTVYCYSTGRVCGDKVYRTLWTTPALLEDYKFEDDLQSCIRKAVVIYDEKAKTQTVQ
jgi:hypothetical protein